jgi:hypothetical protein
MFCNTLLSREYGGVTTMGKNKTKTKYNRTILCNTHKNKPQIEVVSQNIVKLENTLTNLLQKSKYCQPVPYERVKYGCVFSPACVIYWDEVDEISSKLSDLKKKLSELEDESVYLGFDEIEDRFYDV